MRKKEEMYRLLTHLSSELEYDMLKNFLAANDIPVTRLDRGFGGPIRSIYLGNLKTADIEVYVDPENYEAAKELVESDYSNLVDEAFDDGADIGSDEDSPDEGLKTEE